MNPRFTHLRLLSIAATARTHAAHERYTVDDPDVGPLVVAAVQALERLERAAVDKADEHKRSHGRASFHLDPETLVPYCPRCCGQLPRCSNQTAACSMAGCRQPRDPFDNLLGRPKLWRAFDARMDLEYSSARR